jgi:hypothetical protein
LISVGSEPRWTVRIEGEPLIALDATTLAGVTALVTDMAHRLHQAGWIEEEPGHWRRVATASAPPRIER